MGALLNWATALANGDIGVPPGLGTPSACLCTGVSPFMFIVVLAAMSVILTNFMSNSVTCAICMAIAMPSTSLYSGLISPVIAAIAITIGINLAFATAPATPPAAIAADSGWISAGRLFKYGAVAGLVWDRCHAGRGSAHRQHGLLTCNVYREA